MHRSRSSTLTGPAALEWAGRWGQSMAVCQTAAVSLWPAAARAWLRTSVPCPGLLVAAAVLLEAALQRRDRADVKGRAVLTYDLAECQVGQGDLEAACALAHTALDIAEGSIVQPLVLRARAFQASLAPWTEARPVRQLAARVRESELQLTRA
ncbi:hypothetical protein [Kitasatospora herbaricolor]|uniref:Transcriptional regulator n=1 Tax=Kitasatospora herbaricolor TaxID=68217 RepID=A0ABZ1W0G2_9ACTN|nr:hypothetical protein [Kitasatospora herbaricolor]